MTRQETDYVDAENDLIEAGNRMKNGGLNTDPIMRILNVQGDETLTPEQLATIARYDVAVKAWKKN